MNLTLARVHDESAEQGRTQERATSARQEAKREDFCGLQSLLTPCASVGSAMLKTLTSSRMRLGTSALLIKPERRAFELMEGTDQVDAAQAADGSCGSHQEA